MLGESILDAPKKILDSSIWSNNKFKSSYKKIIIDKINDFFEKNAKDAKIKKIFILGSITTFQYNDTSDIDVQVLTDMSDKAIKDIHTSLPNGWSLGDTDHPVNYYVVNSEDNSNKSSTLYDLQNDKWIKEPKKSDIRIPNAYVLEIAKFFMDGIDLRIAEYERDKIELDQLKKQLKDQDTEIDIDELTQYIEQKTNEIKGDLDAIYVGHMMFKAFRKEGFARTEAPPFLINIESTDPNYSINNLVYKQLEAHGYMTKLQKYESLRSK